MERKGEIPGHHFVNFTSENDEIEIINNEGNQICEISVFNKDGKSEPAILNLKENKNASEIKKILSLLLSVAFSSIGFIAAITVAALSVREVSTNPYLVGFPNALGVGLSLIHI